MDIPAIAKTGTSIAIATISPSDSPLLPTAEREVLIPLTGAAELMKNLKKNHVN